MTRLKGLSVIIACLLAGPVLFALMGTPAGHSYGYNIAWATAFEAALDARALYPRHLPDLMFGLGGLDFYFYAPLPFFMAAGPAALLCPGCTVQTVFGLAGGLWWSLSLLAMWPLARRFAPPAAAALACLVYGLLAYHLSVDWIARQAVGEFAAYAFVPLIALGQHDVLTRGRIGPVFPLGFAGLILCHLPTALLSVHVFGTIALVWAVFHPSQALPALLRLAGLGCVGLALAGLYWLPALVLVGDVSPDALYTAALSPEAWLYFGDPVLPGGQLGLVIALAGIGTLAAALATLALAAPSARGTVALWIVLPVALCLLLNTAATGWLWNSWIIERVQFPFRLMVFVDLAAALAAACLFSHLSKGEAGQRRLVGLAGLAGLGLPALVGLGLTAGTVLDGHARTGSAPRMIGAPEYLPPPIFAEVQRRAEATGLEAWQYPRVLASGLDELREGTVPAERLTVRPGQWRLSPQQAGQVTLAVPYWRHMRAETTAGTPIMLTASEPWGLVTLEVPPALPEIEIRIARHWSETAGIVLSLAGLVACLALAGLAWTGRRADRGAAPSA